MLHHVLDLRGNRRSGFGTRSEGHSPVMDIGAGDIEFNDVDSVAGVSAGAAFGVLVQGESADVGYNDTIVHLSQSGDLLLDQHVDAGILETDRIDHPTLALGYARSRVAVSFNKCRTLQGDTSKHVEVVEIREFHTETEGSASRHHGVGEMQSADICRKILYHIISSFLNTGPSLQMRFAPTWVLQVQP